VIFRESGYTTTVDHALNGVESYWPRTEGSTVTNKAATQLAFGFIFESVQRRLMLCNEAVSQESRNRMRVYRQRLSLRTVARARSAQRILRSKIWYKHFHTEHRTQNRERQWVFATSKPLFETISSSAG
jgi:hypothetical protein